MRSSEEKAELVQLLLELAELDRDEYRKVRAQMWESIAKAHGHKVGPQLAEWIGRSS